MPNPALLKTWLLEQRLARQSQLNEQLSTGLRVNRPGDDPLAGVRLQRELESRAFELGGGTYEAPGQLVGDFIAGRPSTEFGEVIPSYKPGVKLGDLHPSLPPYAIDALREAFPGAPLLVDGRVVSIA